MSFHPAASLPRLRALAQTRTMSEGQLFSILTMAALSVAFSVRVVQFSTATFPLNDGGMFYQMARDLEASHFRLPAFTRYNGESIPFAYPPLSLYLCTILDTISPMDLATIFILVPLVCTCLIVAAFVPLANDLCKSRNTALVAVLILAMLPRSYIWLLMGGGVTRSLGMLCAVVALHQAHRAWTKEDRRAALLAGFAAAATALSHLETAWFLVFSLALFAIAFGRTRRGATDAAIIAGVALLAVLPWLVAVIGHHGLAPFMNAARSGDSILSNAAVREAILLTVARGGGTGEPFFPMIAAAGLLGAFVCFVSRRMLLPIWWLAIIVLDFRAFATFASLPVAIMAAIAMTDVVWPGIMTAARTFRSPRQAKLAGLLGILVLGYFAATGVVYRPAGSDQAALRPLAPADRMAMAWVREHTAAGGRFFLVPERAWEVDRTLEWFPALTARSSVTTVQGSEWTGEFRRRIADHYRAWGCANAGSTCLDAWSSATGRSFDYVYLPNGSGRPCCTLLASSLMADARYVEIYDGPGAIIFSRVVP